MRKALLAVSIGLAAGCGGGGGGSSGGNTGGTYSALCDQLVTALFAKQVSCTRVNPDVLALAKASAVADCNTSVTKETAAGRVTLDTTKAGDCVAAIQGATCASLGGGGQLPPGCTSLVAGKVANAGACYDDIECTSGSCSSSTTQACPGVCQPLGGSGGACPCGAGLYCAGSTCAPLKTSGACPTFEECAPGYQCLGNPATCVASVGLNGDCTANPEACANGYLCTANKCVSPPRVNDACDPLTAPVGLGCYCDAATNRCLPWKAPGAACSSFFECNLINGDTCSAGKCVAGTSTSCLPP